ncbi:hypothetical protein ACEPAG_9475 [Sanghuangporus baumii]
MDMVLLLAPEERDRCVSSQDACFLLKDKENTTEHHTINSWDDIALTVSYRRISNDETRKENVRKIVSNMQLAMARDPCRRFTFGITVENTTMRLWFCSRASPVVSKPFDFSTDLDLLIHVFLSLAFATKEELGWDPTIRPFIRDDGRRVYRIDVDGETYETDQVLSKSSSEQLTGHATRVWIVQRPGSDDLHVLKDVWIEDDERPEHFVYEMLLHDVEELYGADVRQQVASHLLTPIAYCLVRANGEEDDTTNVMMRGYTPSFKETYRANVENLGSGDEGVLPSTEIGIEGLERGDLRDPLHWYNPVRKIVRRRHYRVVFREVAKPLYAVRDLTDAFSVLSDSAKILKWIHGAGWVHRDLSIGNLYLYQDRGLIGDFEYAQRKNSDARLEVQIGTPDFMAIEAAARCYLYLPELSNDEFGTQFAALLEGRLEEAEQMIDSCRPPPFSYNDLHDLESLWWIAIWELFSNISPVGSSQSGEQDVQRESAAAKIFSGCSAVVNRQQFIQAANVYYDEVAWMPERLRNVKFILDSLRIELVRSYRKLEATFLTAQTQILDDIHDGFQKQFTKCMDPGNDVDLMPCEGLDLRLQSSRKHFVNHALSASCTQPVVQVKDHEIGSALAPEEKELGVVADHAFAPLARKRKRVADDFVLPIRRRRKARPRFHPVLMPICRIWGNMPYASSSKGKQSTPPPEARGEPCFDYVEDSPAKLRNSHTKKYQEGDLSSMREAVREEVGPFIPEISLNDFMKYLLPPMKDWIDLPEVMALLEEEGDVITSSGKKVFKTFEKAPKNRKEHEDTVFAPLDDIYGKVCRHATRDDVRVNENFVLAMLSNITPTSERGVRQRSDAGLIPKRLEEFARVAMAKKGESRDEKRTRERRKQELMAEGKTISWYDIAMTYEMRLEEIIDRCNDVS